MANEQKAKGVYGLKVKLYDRIKVPVRTIDRFIAGLLILLAVLLIYGIIS